MRLLWISGIDGFCHRYEVLHRAAQARLFGAQSCVRHFTDGRLESDVARADLVLAYRTPDAPLVRAALAQARRLGVPVLGTIDDLVFVPDAGSLPSLAHLSAPERALWVDGVRRYRAVLDVCDGFIAPTEPLLDVARSLGWRAWLHRDAASAVDLAIGDEARRRAPLRAGDAGTAVVLGYFSGTPTHDRDFATIAPALAEVLATHPAATLLVVGPLALGGELGAFGPRVRRRSLVPWTELPELIAQVDVNLAPLELERPFAAAKGEVKYLEAAAVAVPTVASPTSAFRHAIRDGWNGRLASGLDGWRRALGELIVSPALRRALGEAARADLEQRFSPAARAGELRKILTDALRCRGRITRGAVRPERRPLPAAGDDGAWVALEPDARPELALCPGEAVSPPLAAGSVLAQRFAVGTGPVRRIDLLPVTYGQRLAHHVRLRVVDADGRVVLRRRRHAARAPDRAWWSFAVPAGRLARDRSYLLELAVEEARVGAALSFALAAPPGDGAARTEVVEPGRHDGASLAAPLALRAFAAWDLDALHRQALDRADTLPAALLAAADADGGRRRVVFAARDGSERRFALGGLLGRARRVRDGLAALGLGAGDAIVIVLPTGPDLVAAYLAALFAGALPALASTPTQRVADPAAYRGLLRGIVADAGARLVYCDASTAAILAPDGSASFHGARLVGPRVAARAPSRHLPAPVAPDAVATIQYSSGSTGAPKGARLSHRAILNNVRAVRDALAIGPRDVSVNWIPIYHDMGLIDALLLPLLCGCETVLLPTGDFVREPWLWLQALSRHGGTISWAPNFAYALCVQRIDERDAAGLDLSRWRLAINAAEPVLAETIAAFAARFAARGFRREAMTPAWGLAENVTIATAHPPGLEPRIDRIDRAAAAAGRALPVTGSDAAFACVAVGRALPGCRVEIRDADRALGEREIGDVWLRSDSLFSGYGASAPPDGSGGWLATGDRGYRAGDDLFFVARTKDVIVIAGEKYAPHDVETAISQVPGVRAGCAVAFGVRDETRGTEALAAVVETRLAGGDERAALARAIRAHVTRATGLALRHLELVPPGGVAKTTSGKLARGATRARYAGALT